MAFLCRILIPAVYQSLFIIEGIRYVFKSLRQLFPGLNPVVYTDLFSVRRLTYRQKGSKIKKDLLSLEQAIEEKRGALWSEIMSIKAILRSCGGS